MFLRSTKNTRAIPLKELIKASNKVASCATNFTKNEHLILSSRIFDLFWSSNICPLQFFTKVRIIFDIYFQLNLVLEVSLIFVKKLCWFCVFSCSKKFRNIHRKTPVLESLLLKGDSNIEVLLWYCEMFNDTYFEEQLRMAALASLTRVPP